METQFKEISGRHTPDAWLDPFLPALRAVGDTVLELGCGPGEDAATLAAHGFRVFACDRSRTAIRAATITAPAAQCFVADLQSPLPVCSGCAQIVVASLSIHYFPWETTRQIVAEVRQALVPGGCFLFRVNATDDTNFGAGAGEEIEPNYYRVPPDGNYFRMPPDGRNNRPYKRFFDEMSVHTLLTGWRIAHLAHRTIDRYGEPKQVWECLAMRDES
jgi:SAM-dependent methyltransferase